MVRMLQEFFGNAPQQPRLDLERRLPDGQAGAIRDAKDVRIDRERRFAEGDC